MIPIAAEGKAAQLASRAPLAARIIKGVQTVKGAAKGVTLGTAMWTGGKIARATPDVDFRVPDSVKKLSEYRDNAAGDAVLNDVTDALARTPTTEQVRLRRLLGPLGQG